VLRAIADSLDKYKMPTAGRSAVVRGDRAQRLAPHVVDGVAFGSAGAWLTVQTLAQAGDSPAKQTCEWP
jgi:hypothetical protein